MSNEANILAKIYETVTKTAHNISVLAIKVEDIDSSHKKLKPLVDNLDIRVRALEGTDTSKKKIIKEHAEPQHKSNNHILNSLTYVALTTIIVVGLVAIPCIIIR